MKFGDPRLNVPKQFDYTSRRRHFRNNFRLEVADDVISSVAVEDVGQNIREEFVDSRSNHFCRSTKR